MKKLLLTTTLAGLCFAAGADALFAQSIIMTNDGKENHVATIEMTKAGDFSYTKEKGGPAFKFKKSDVKWAWIPKPKAIKDADAAFKAGNDEEAIKLYAAAAETYGDLGWEVYCLNKEAELMVKAGRNADAIKVLAGLKDYAKVSPKNESQLIDAYRMLTNAYVADKDYASALALAEKLTLSANDDVACKAYLCKGDIFSAAAASQDKDKNMKAAAISYFQASLLFPKAKNNDEALFKSYQTLRAMKDVNASKFADLLRKNHPSSKYVKELK